MYPRDAPAKAWFEYYAERFNTVEINNTFYRLPTTTTVNGWREQAPSDFLYAVKVGQFGTHRMKLKNPKRWLTRHLDVTERLRRHCGPQLVQLPPRWRRDVARLDEFLSVAPRRHRWTIEVRDRSWLHDDVFEILAHHDAALCIHDMFEHPWLRTTDWTYIRFHGPSAASARYQGRYTGRRLWRVADRLSAWLDDGCDVYAYFNNDHHGHAVADATWLRDRLDD